MHACRPKKFLHVLLAGQALLQSLLPGMRAAGYGRIVNIISTSVKEPLAGLGVSNTVRAAVAAWAKTLAGELGVTHEALYRTIAALQSEGHLIKENARLILKLT